ncbi:UNVERIFIED_CONTAM: hypothetical protein FKN15_039538 [Acipenser sinensis]
MEAREKRLTTMRTLEQGNSKTPAQNSQVLNKMSSDDDIEAMFNLIHLAQRWLGPGVNNGNTIYDSVVSEVSSLSPSSANGTFRRRDMGIEIRFCKLPLTGSCRLQFR